MRADWNRVARYGKAIVLAAAIARFGLVMFTAQTYTRGDYYHTLGTLGFALAQVTWFKYLPVIALPYLAARRWWRSILVFLAASAGLLLLAHWAFGLERCINNHLPGLAASQLTGLVSNAAFCDGPNRLLQVLEDSQERNVRYAMCRLSGAIGIPAPVLFMVLAATTLGLSIWGFFRLERRVVLLPVERWRRVWVLSIVVVVATTFFYPHYYYLCLLILPMNMLLIRWLADETPRPSMIAAWLTTYALLSAWIIPPSFTGRLLNVDVWRFYTTSLAYFTGEMLLLGLLLHQYLTLADEHRQDLGCVRVLCRPFSLFVLHLWPQASASA